MLQTNYHTKDGRNGLIYSGDKLHAQRTVAMLRSSGHRCSTGEQVTPKFNRRIKPASMRCRNSHKHFVTEGASII